MSSLRLWNNNNNTIARAVVGGKSFGSLGEAYQHVGLNRERAFSLSNFVRDAQQCCPDDLVETKESLKGMADLIDSYKILNGASTVTLRSVVSTISQVKDQCSDFVEHESDKFDAETVFRTNLHSLDEHAERLSSFVKETEDFVNKYHEVNAKYQLPKFENLPVEEGEEGGKLRNQYNKAVDDLKKFQAEKEEAESERDVALTVVQTHVDNLEKLENDEKEGMKKLQTHKKALEENEVKKLEASAELASKFNKQVTMKEQFSQLEEAIVLAYKKRMDYYDQEVDKIKNFQIETMSGSSLAHHIHFMLDISGSMAGGIIHRIVDRVCGMSRFALLKEIYEFTINSLRRNAPKGTTVSCDFFNHEVLKFFGPTNLGSIPTTIPSNYSPTGYTDFDKVF